MITDVLLFTEPLPIIIKSEWHKRVSNGRVRLDTARVGGQEHPSNWLLFMISRAQMAVFGLVQVEKPARKSGPVNHWQ